MKPVKLVYFGSPDCSATILSHLLQDPSPKKYPVCAVITQPDKPFGRQKTITPSPIAQLAHEHQLPLFKPPALDQNNLSRIKLFKPDLFLVVSYGKIIPQSWLKTPSVASLNLHFSLLPQYRGALCVAEALKNQDPHTGVTLMEMDQQLDHGPIISQAKQVVDINDNLATLTSKLTHTAIRLLKKTLPLYLSGRLTPQPQDETQATYTKTIKDQVSFIPWKNIDQALNGQNAPAIHALIRSLTPRPGAWSEIKDLKLKLLKTKLHQQKLIIETIQLPGKSPISWSQFCSGYSSLLSSPKP